MSPCMWSSTGNIQNYSFPQIIFYWSKKSSKSVSFKRKKKKDSWTTSPWRLTENVRYLSSDQQAQSAQDWGVSGGPRRSVLKPDKSQANLRNARHQARCDGKWESNSVLHGQGQLQGWPSWAVLGRMASGKALWETDKTSGS